MINHTVVRIAHEIEAELDRRNYDRVITRGGKVSWPGYEVVVSVLGEIEIFHRIRHSALTGAMREEVHTMLGKYRECARGVIGSSFRLRMSNPRTEEDIYTPDYVIVSLKS